MAKTLKLDLDLNLKNVRNGIKKLISSVHEGSLIERARVGFQKKLAVKIAAIVAIFESLQPITDLMKLIAFSAFYIIAKGITELKDSTLPSIIEKLTSLYNFVKKFLDGVFKLISKTDFKKIFDNDLFKTLMQKLITAVVSPHTLIISAINSLISKFDIFNKISNVLENVGTFLNDTLSPIFENIQSGLSNVVSVVGGVAANIFNKLLEIVNPILKKIGMDELNKIEAPEIGIYMTVQNEARDEEGNIVYGGQSKKVNDLIITKDGQVFETHPDDMIIATKGSMPLTIDEQFNFYGVSPDKMIQIIKRELGGPGLSTISKL